MPCSGTVPWDFGRGTRRFVGPWRAVKPCEGRATPGQPVSSARRQGQLSAARRALRIELPCERCLTDKQCTASAGTHLVDLARAAHHLGQALQRRRAAAQHAAPGGGHARRGAPHRRCAHGAARRGGAGRGGAWRGGAGHRLGQERQPAAYRRPWQAPARPAVHQHSRGTRPGAGPRPLPAAPTGHSTCPACCPTSKRQVRRHPLGTRSGGSLSSMSSQARKQSTNPADLPCFTSTHWAPGRAAALHPCPAPAWRWPPPRCSPPADRKGRNEPRLLSRWAGERCMVLGTPGAAHLARGYRAVRGTRGGGRAQASTLAGQPSCGMRWPASQPASQPPARPPAGAAAPRWSGGLTTRGRACACSSFLSSSHTWGERQAWGTGRGGSEHARSRAAAEALPGLETPAPAARFT